MELLFSITCTLNWIRKKEEICKFVQVANVLFEHEIWSLMNVFAWAEK